MSNWFDTEYLIRQQQMELNRKAREAWKFKFKHDPVSLRERLFVGKKRRFPAAKSKTRTSN